MKTIKEARLDQTLLRLVYVDKGFVGLAIVSDTTKLRIEGATADEVWNRLRGELGKTNPQYVGYAGARNRFLHFFPNGFHSNDYEANERDYKVAAREKLVRSVPLADTAEGAGFGEAVLSVFRAKNLLFPFEKTRLQDVLRGPFIQAAARFTLNPTNAALLDIERVLKPHDAAKWTVVTYLPFLWRPEAHRLLKPEVTKDFAARVGHRFASDYAPRFNPDVYTAFSISCRRPSMSWPTSSRVTGSMSRASSGLSAIIRRRRSHPDLDVPCKISLQNIFRKII
jgi:hypothetical protein